MKEGGSGITQVNSKEAVEDAFHRFIVGSIVVGSPMRGASGFLLRYQNKVDSVYKSSDVDTYGDPVHTILVKFVSISSNLERKEFDSELVIQKNIYDRTKDGLEPLCPAIVFSGIFGENHPIITQDLKLNVKKLPVSERGRPLKIGVIAMEFMEYTSMHQLLKSPSYGMTNFREEVFAAAAFLLIELAEKTGYTQGDFHFNNIFFKVIPEDAEYPYFLTDANDYLKIARRLKPIIIDFGRAIEIDTTIYPISQLYSEYKFRNLLGCICAQGCNNIYYNYILKYPGFYGWASGLQYDILVGNGAGLNEEKMNPTELGNLLAANLLKTEDYIEKLRIKPNTFTFFKNGPGDFIDCNMTIVKTTKLNSEFDGENGIMSKMITARNNSNIKIIESIPELEALAQDKIALEALAHDEDAFEGISPRIRFEGGKRSEKAKNRKPRKKRTKRKMNI